MAQFKQCMAYIDETIKKYPGCLLFFGGDLNIRDQEVSVFLYLLTLHSQVCNIPGGVADAWLSAGADNKTRYTWDTSKNDNKASRFSSRCRFVVI